MPRQIAELSSGDLFCHATPLGYRLFQAECRFSGDTGHVYNCRELYTDQLMYLDEHISVWLLSELDDAVVDLHRELSIASGRIDVLERTAIGQRIALDEYRRVRMQYEEAVQELRSTQEEMVRLRSLLKLYRGQVGETRLLREALRKLRQEVIGVGESQNVFRKELNKLREERDPPANLATARRLKKLER